MTDVRGSPQFVLSRLLCWSLMWLTVSVIFRVHVPAGSSPHVWTDMKSQFLNPFADVSLSRSASSTVVVPGDGRSKLTHTGTWWIQSNACFLLPLTCWRGECDVQVASPGVFDAGLHLHVLQWLDCVLLALAGFGWNLYGDLPGCFQLPEGCMKMALNEARERLIKTLPAPLPLNVTRYYCQCPIKTSHFRD